MRAAVLRELGRLPEPADVEDPGREAGQALLEVIAAPLNPLDVAVGAGRFYGGSPPVPYVPGCEAVGRVVEGESLRAGKRVYVFGDGLGLKGDGTMAERVVVAEAAAFPVPEGADDAVAAACGIAGLAGWMPLARRAPVSADDVVLVLGATGTAGSIAVQAARLLGAKRVVAAGRRPDRLARARELGADDTIELRGEGLADAMRSACGPDGPTLVYDALWGEPVRAAVDAALPGARIVNLGQSAGPEATLPSGAVRGKQLEILGYSDFALSADAYGDGYAELLDHVIAGRIRIDVETVPLERVAEAWQRQASGGATKLVVIP